MAASPLPIDFTTHHTAGPWTIARSEGGYDPAVVDSRDGTIAQIEGKGWSRALDIEVEANARLIAAAPDLLAALQRIAVDASIVIELINQMSTDPDPETWIEGIVRAAKGAIAKATGEVLP